MLLMYFCVYVYIPVLPQIIPFDFGDLPVHVGQSVQVQCFVSEGDLPLSIQWLFNDKRIEAFREVSVTTVGKRSSILSIDSVSYDLAGNYTCKTKNEAGETLFSAELQVNGYSVTSLLLSSLSPSSSPSSSSNIWYFMLHSYLFWIKIYNLFFFFVAL